MKLFKTVKKIFRKNPSGYMVICPVCENIQDSEPSVYNIIVCTHCGVFYNKSFATKILNFSNGKKEKLSDTERRVRERINRLKKGKGL